jgi:hypothetical protein
MSIKDIPQLKINIGGTDYTSETIGAVVTLKENNFCTAQIVLDNYQSKFYNSLVDTFDEVKVYVKEYYDSSYTQLFGGWARELLPIHNSAGETLTLGCKGYGSAFAELHCNREYGYESTNGTSLDELSEILDDVVNDFAEKSFDDWATGHTFDHTLITDNFDATTFSFINNPYRHVIDVINHSCNIATAIAAGADAENPTAAGPHWIVDPSKYFLVAKIADHAAGANSPEARWADWWNTDQAGSTLVQGVDFQDYEVIDKSSEFANNVVLITDFRRPAFDYWTEDSGGQALWTADGTIGKADSVAQFIVGSHSLLLSPNDAVPVYAYYDSGASPWDISKWGSERSIPTVNFYTYSSQYAGTPKIYLSDNTNARKTDYFSADITPSALATWNHNSIPIGPYWGNAEVQQPIDWATVSGSGAPFPQWSNIDTIEFVFDVSGPGDNFYIDDLHFAGKIARGAYVSDNITTNKEYQKVFISRTAMDDSCIAAIDTGDAARLAKAELLRRIANPFTIRFTTMGLLKNMMAGQKTHIHTGLQVDGSTFTVNSDMRVMRVEHAVASGGAYSRVVATDDLYNTFPISSTDQWALQQEYTLINSREAKNIRAGAEVDLLVPILKKNYT